MTDDPRVAAVCGSLRDESKTRVVLGEALAAARDAGATTDLVDLREYDLPAYDPDPPEPEDAAALSETVDRADAVLLGTPNYHGSYSGALKTALDYLGRDEFGGTTVGLVEVAGGSYPRPALAHLRGVCRTLDAWTLPREVGVPNAHSTVDGDGIRDADVAERVCDLGSELVEYAGVDRYPDVVERPAASARGD